MKYKQYNRIDEYGHNKKIICSLKTVSAGEVGDFMEGYEGRAGNYDEQGELIHYTRDNFRSMRISFIDERGDKAEDCWEFESDDDLDDAELLVGMNYVQILLGRIPNWTPMSIQLSSGHVCFQVGGFNDEGVYLRWNHIFLKTFPLDTKIKIEIESHADVEPDTYIIMNLGADSKHEVLVIEEYKGGKLLRTSELGRDEHGEYELITET